MVALRTIAGLLVLSQGIDAFQGLPSARRALARPPSAPLTPVSAPPSPASRGKPLFDAMQQQFNPSTDGWISDQWLRNLKNMPRSFILQRIAGHVLFNVFVATVFVRMRALGVVTSLPPGAHALTGAFLGLLVTFRTNTCYGKYHEARLIWGGIMNVCRDITVGVSTWIKPRKPIEAKCLIQDLMRYPQQVAKQCRDMPLARGDTPTDVTLAMQQWLHRAALPESWEKLTLYELAIDRQSKNIELLTDATGALNRVINTPVPFSYTRHTSRGLSIWCSTLPCALGPNVGAAPTIFLVALISWFVLGIDAIGQLLERPFSQPENMGEGFDFGLPAEVLGQGIANEVERIGTTPEVGALV